MPIQKRATKPEAEMDCEELALRWRARGGRAILVNRRDDGRWETSAVRIGSTSTAAVNVGEVGEPLESVIRNLLVDKAASRTVYRGENTPPPRKKLVLKRTRNIGAK